MRNIHFREWLQKIHAPYTRLDKFKLFLYDLITPQGFFTYRLWIKAVFRHLGISIPSPVKPYHRYLVAVDHILERTYYEVEEIDERHAEWTASLVHHNSARFPARVIRKSHVVKDVWNYEAQRR